jgi:hypothetical protein
MRGNCLEDTNFITLSADADGAGAWRVTMPEKETFETVPHWSFSSEIPLSSVYSKRHAAASSVDS